jgi:hypothetical protein
MEQPQRTEYYKIYASLVLGQTKLGGLTDDRKGKRVIITMHRVQVFFRIDKNYIASVKIKSIASIKIITCK